MKGRGKSKDIVRKHIQVKPEHMTILQGEADEKYEGNLSMLIRTIIDGYIDNKYSVRFSDVE